MRLIILAVTLTVSTMSFGEGINSKSPSYLCQLIGYEASNKLQQVRIDQQILIVPNSGNLFEAYTLSTEDDLYFQFFIGDRAKNHVVINDQTVVISFDNGKYIIKINEQTGQGSFEQKDKTVTNFIFGNSRGQFKKGMLEGCQRLRDEEHALQMEMSFRAALLKKDETHWASVNE